MARPNIGDKVGIRIGTSAVYDDGNPLDVGIIRGVIETNNIMSMHSTDGISFLTGADIKYLRKPSNFNPGNTVVIANRSGHYGGYGSSTSQWVVPSELYDISLSDGFQFNLAGYIQANSFYERSRSGNIKVNDEIVHSASVGRTTHLNMSYDMILYPGDVIQIYTNALSSSMSGYNWWHRVRMGDITFRDVSATPTVLPMPTPQYTMTAI